MSYTHFYRKNEFHYSVREVESIGKREQELRTKGIAER